MAKASDVDTQTFVSKYLNRQVVVRKSDADVDPSVETSATIEAVAISFLLHPQAALWFVVQAKIALQQMVKAIQEMVDFLLGTFDDLNNPSDVVTDTTELVDAQTALLELDRIGNVSSDLPAFTRYQESINKFLNNQLAPYLKRHNRKEFERSGIEAKNDLFNTASSLQNPIEAMISKLELLINSVSSFEEVDLSKVVSRRTISTVRSSLNAVQKGLTKNRISKTVAAIELLAGSAALQSISRARGVYDPLLNEGLSPSGRTISVDRVTIPSLIPTYGLELKENGVSVSADSLGISVGDLCDVDGFSSTVSSISDSVLSFPDTPPAGTGMLPTVTSYVIPAVQGLLRDLRQFSGAFDSDVSTLQKVLSPLIGVPTLAQINDARRAIGDMSDRLGDLRSVLSGVVVPDRSSQDLKTCRLIMKSLEERGLDRAVGLLQEGDFSEFFGLTNENASRGSRLMKATEIAGRAWLSQATTESETKDPPDVPMTSDSHILPTFGESDDG